MGGYPTLVDAASLAENSTTRSEFVRALKDIPAEKLYAGFDEAAYVQLNHGSWDRAPLPAKKGRSYKMRLL